MSNTLTIEPGYSSMSNPQSPLSEKVSPAEKFLSRKDLCARWGVSIDFVRTLEAEDRLHPIRLSARCLRYRLSEIVAIEFQRS